MVGGPHRPLLPSLPIFEGFRSPPQSPGCQVTDTKMIRPMKRRYRAQNDKSYNPFADDLTYLPLSVFKVVLHKSNPPKIRQLILCYYSYEE